jgi:hypothetical protein
VYTAPYPVQDCDDIRESEEEDEGQSEGSDEPVETERGWGLLLVVGVLHATGIVHEAVLIPVQDESSWRTKVKIDNNFF